jgi:UDP-N-acetylmuramate dehydrogenase
LSGIPGSVGGTPIQNVGAYGQEVADSIERVTVFDRKAGVTTILTASECGFSYRMSRFKASDAERFVVCDVALRLRQGNPTVTYPDVVAYVEKAGLSSPDAASVREAVLSIRRGKGMVVDTLDPDTRSVGSFFMNPIVTAGLREKIASVAGEAAPGFMMSDGRVKVPAAWLIERAGFKKGYSEGAVGISSKHPLAIVTRKGATARDVLAVAGRIKRAVAERFGVWLLPEPIFVGFGENADVEILKEGGKANH